MNERCKKYGCNGQCYTSTRMCPMIEHCPETRKIEFLATIIAIVTMSAIPIAGFVMVAYAIINYI